MALAQAVPAAPAATGAARSAQVDALFRAFDRDDSPGCALGVYQDGRLAYQRGYGMADLERGVRIAPTSAFDVGSVAKQFTALAIHLLVQDGRVGLDDPVRKHVPELPDYGRPLTIRHLLHHTSGLRDYLRTLDLAGLRDEDWTTEEDALAAIVRQQGLVFATGSQYRYSNSNYFLLSVVVKRVTGRSLRDFARDRIFDPLGMAHTQFNDRHDRIVRDRALSYTAAPEGGFRLTLSDFEQTGDGGLNTTIPDLERWERNFLTPTVGGPTVLAARLALGRLDDGSEIDYAAGGLRVRAWRGVPVVRHGGSWIGYRAHFLRLPEQRLAIACLCNTDTADAQALTEQVAEIYAGPALKPAPHPPRPPPTAPTPEPSTITGAQDFTGAYECDEVGGWPLVLEAEAAQLRVRHRTIQGALIPAGPDIFRLRSMELRFQRANARVTGFVMSWPEDETRLTYRRREEP